MQNKTPKFPLISKIQEYVFKKEEYMSFVDTLQKRSLYKNALPQYSNGALLLMMAVKIVISERTESAAYTDKSHWPW